MSELERSLRDLAGPASEVDVDAIGRRATRIRRRRHGAMGGAAASVVIVAAVIVASAWDRGDDQVVVVAPPVTTESPGTTEATTTTQPSPESGQPLVMAGPSGVEVVARDGASTSLTTDPAAIAFGIGPESVVFQNIDPVGSADFFPPASAGAVNVWAGGEVRALPSDPDARRTRLLDAAMIDDVPLVLVAERFGEVGPDDTFEALVQIDLRDDTRTTIVQRPAWESGHYAARFLPDGDVVGLLSAEAHILLARWTATSDEAIWTTEVGIDISVDLSLRDGEITLIQPSFDEAQDLTPVLTVSEHDEATGGEESSHTVYIDDPADEIETGLFCRDWVSSTEVVCGRSGGEPISVSVTDGFFESLAGESGSMPTVVRPTELGR